MPTTQDYLDDQMPTPQATAEIIRQQIMNPELWQADLKFFPMGEWATAKGLAHCVEQEGFGIVGAVIDRTGEGYLLDLLLAAPELLAACQLSLRNAESIIYQQPAKIEDSVELQSLRTWRDTLKAAIAKATGG